MKKKLLIYLFILTIITSCGFKVVNYNELLNFQVNQINSSGNKFINYKLKNKLNKFKNNYKEKLINVNFDSKKKKIIKEKNIKNEITKYKILITSEVILNFIEINRQQKFSINSTGDFLVGDKYSETLTNEKRLVEDLTDDISDQIKKKMFIIFDDF